MRTYPIMLNVRGRLCVVVGGGNVGLRKVTGLREAGARVRLVSPELENSAGLEGVEIVRAAYDRGQLAGALLAFACTDDPDVNAHVYADARQAGVLINVVDKPEQCDFYAPATCGAGDVVVAVGTGGSAPALAGVLAKELARHLPERIGEFAAALDEVRAFVHAHEPVLDKRMAIMKFVAGKDGHAAFLRAGAKGLMELARQRM